jgi:hypothetical protein
MRGIRTYRGGTPVARVSELAKRDPAIAKRLITLCDQDLPDVKRDLLAEAMNWLGSPEALSAALKLIDDRKAIPRGVWDALEGAFVERRPYGDSPGVHTEHARAANDLRLTLFKMANGDEKRRKSGRSLLAQIEEWRLERGRPTGEPRHPDIQSGIPWPPPPA